MITELTLPARLDLTAAKVLAGNLATMTGDIVLNASAVTHLGGLCLQILLASQQSCTRLGHRFTITARSTEFDDALTLFGVDPKTLGIEVTA